MANLVFFISLALIWSSLISPSEEDYPCKLSGQYYVESDLDDTVYYRYYREPADFEAMHKELINANRQETYRGIPVAELLAMVDVSEDKCNLAEFEKRMYYRAIQLFGRSDRKFKRGGDRAQATSFIDHFIDELRQVCNVKSRLVHQEAEATISTDRAIIQKVVSAGRLERKTNFTSSSVVKAAEKYLKSEPGKKDFVLGARRLRIVDACAHAKYIQNLVWGDGAYPYAEVNLSDDQKRMCLAYDEEYFKREDHYAKARLVGRGFRKAFQVGAKGMGLVGDSLQATFDERILFITGIILFFMSASVWGLPYIAYKIIKASMSKVTVRSLKDPKYEIYRV